MVHFVANVDLLRMRRVLAVDMLKGNRGGVNADSIHAQKKNNIEHCDFCQEFPCDYYLQAYDPSEEFGESFIVQDNLRIEKKLTLINGYKEKYKARILTPNIKRADKLS